MSEVENQQLALRFGEKGCALRKGMAEIARLALQRLPPFSSLGEPRCIGPYEHIIQRRSGEDQKLVRHAFIKYMEFLVSDHLCHDPKAVQTWREVDAEYQREYSANYSPLHVGTVEVSMKESKQIVREVCASELSGFTYRAGKNAILTFTKEAAPAVEYVCIDFDFGSLGPGSFTPYLSTRVPDYSVEVGTLMCWARRTWRYSTPEECRNAVTEVCALMAILIPALERQFSSIGLGKL